MYDIVIQDLGTRGDGVHNLFHVPQVPLFLERPEAHEPGGRKGMGEMAEDPKKSLYSTCLIPRPPDFWPLALTSGTENQDRIEMKNRGASNG